MGKDSFILYTEQKEVIDKLTDEQAGKLIKAIYEYVSTDRMPELEMTIDLVFTLFKIALDKNKEKYQNVIERNRENGLKGGRPKKTKKPSGFLENPTKPKKADNDNEYDNEYDNDTTDVVVEGDSCDDGFPQSDGCVDKVVKFYEENYGTISPFVFEILDDYRTNFTDDIIIFALQLGVEANAKNIKYVKAILNNWEKANVKTLLDAKRENENKKQDVKQQEKPKNVLATSDSQYQSLDKFYANLG